MKVNKEKKKRLFLILVVPIVIFIPLFLIPSISIVRIGGTNQWVYKYEIERKAPGLLDSIRDIIEIPLDLRWYKFCFDTGNTTFLATFDNGQEQIDPEPHIKLGLLLPNGEWQELEMKKGYRYCTNVDLKNNFMYSFKFESSFSVNETTQGHCVDLKLLNDFKVDKYPNVWTLLSKFILVLLAYWAILWLVTRIIYFYHHGIK